MPLRANLANGSSGVPSQGFGAQRTTDILGEFGVALEWQRRLAQAVGVLFALCLVEAGGFQKDLIEDFRGQLVDGHPVRVVASATDATERLLRCCSLGDGGESNVRFCVRLFAIVVECEQSNRSMCCGSGRV